MHTRELGMFHSSQQSGFQFDSLSLCPKRGKGNSQCMESWENHLSPLFVSLTMFDYQRVSIVTIW